MNTNHQMNYYDYAKTLSAEGVMTALIGGGAGPEPEPEQHEYVDLGLSVKWATCNIGANTPEETGLYFAWGETSGYTSGQVGTDKDFSWEDYQWGNPNDDPSTLVTDSLIDSDGNLLPKYDAASENWKNGWRMPTKEEFEELLENTTSAWTEVNGISGMLLTSTVEGYEEETLFFPAVGRAESGGVSNVGEYGEYWSASLGSEDVGCACELNFDSGLCGVCNGYRCYGCAVRPVSSQNI